MQSVFAKIREFPSLRQHLCFPAQGRFIKARHARPIAVGYFKVDHGILLKNK